MDACVSLDLGCLKINFRGVLEGSQDKMLYEYGKSIQCLYGAKMQHVVVDKVISFSRSKMKACKCSATCCSD